MIRKTIPLVALLATFAFAAPLWAADPTLHEVYQAAEAGHLDQAESMMQQVLRDHPDSAKAHFVEAELLTREGRTAGARGEFATAQRLDPQLSFAKPGAVAELRARLGEGGQAMPLAPAGASRSDGGFNWWPVLIGVLALVVIVRIVRGMTPPRQAVAPPGYGPGGPGYPTGGAPGYGGPMGSGPGMGSGILGGLATGVAVGAGVVAGEALMHRVMDGSGHGSGLIPEANAASLPDGNADMGGNDFGVSDSGSWDSGSSDLGGDDW